MAPDSAPDGAPMDFETYRDRVRKPLLRIFRTFGVERRQWLYVGLVVSLFERLASLAPPFILGIAIDAVFNQSTAYSLPLVPPAWIPAGRGAQLWLSVGLMTATGLLAAALIVPRGLALDYYSHRLMHEVRTETYEKLQRLDMGFFDEQETGELMSVLNNDISNFETFFDDALGLAVRITTVLLGVVAILLYLNWQLALVTLVAVPLLAVLTLWFMRRVEPVYDAIRSAVGDLNTRLENNLGGIQLIKSTATESHERERVTEASWNYFATNWDRIKIELLYFPGTQLISRASFIATFVIGGVWLVNGPPGPFTGTLSVGELTTFLFMSQRFTGPLRNIAQVINHYENARASGKRVFGLLDMPVRVQDAEDAVELDDVAGEVEYDDVDFSYEEGGETILEDIDFTAEPGDTVALVGPTGAGKSTALKLLMRLYDVDSGAVRVDGHDVREVSMESLRSHVGYVSQDTYLFGDSVHENIAYGNFDASREEVIEAAETAEAHDFIRNLPEGYDTQVGERGVKLSGGQRQRVSIARTVLQDPEILVFDEATSAVDTETEMLIQRGLDKLSEDRTTFVIAHRLSTVRDADLILTFEDGEIVERGTHGELIDQGGLYANLWQVQAGEIDELPEEFVEEARERTAMQGQDGE